MKIWKVKVTTEDAGTGRVEIHTYHAESRKLHIYSLGFNVYTQEFRKTVVKTLLSEGHVPCKVINVSPFFVQQVEE